MKKGIAVSQIVLLVLGILVLAVVAYLLYTNFLTSSGSFNAEKCRAEELRVCTAAKIINNIGTDGLTKTDYTTSSCGKTTGYKVNCQVLGITGSGTATQTGQQKEVGPPKPEGGFVAG